MIENEHKESLIYVSNVCYEYYIYVNMFFIDELFNVRFKCISFTTASDGLLSLITFHLSVEGSLSCRAPAVTRDLNVCVLPVEPLHEVAL